MSILNYAITSNHVHLLVRDNGVRDVIPKSIQLIAGRTGQEFNQRKKRKGAYWEDRYHATAVENGDHLLQCIVYIDMNMVRAGVVNHPADWPFSGYSEIQNPKRKNVLINYTRLRELLGFDTYDRVQSAHRKWVESCLETGENARDDKWTCSVAVGSLRFTQDMKELMGGLVSGRQLSESGKSFQLREAQRPYYYSALFKAEKDEIGHQNSYFWS